MNICVLGGREIDQSFLEGKIIWIEIETARSSETIEAGSQVVIQLSNRKKYKGMIRMTDLQTDGPITSGKIAVQRK